MKTFQKQLAFFLLGILFPVLAKAQNQDHFFKVLPSLDGTEALWIQKMYEDNPNVFEVNQLYEQYYKEHKWEKNIHTQNYKYWLKQIKPYVQVEGNIVVPSYNSLSTKHHNLKEQRNFKSGSRTSDTWSNVGPFNTYKNDGTLNLRPTQVNVYCIEIAPSDNDIMYCATEGGGLFKSIDHGLNWNLITLNEVFTKAQDIKVHPFDTDILYVAHNNQIYKSTDGGDTWELNFTASGTVEQFYIHKTNPSIVFAATSGGLYQTMDDGGSWTNIFDERCWDIEAHAIAADTMYLSIHNAAEKRAEIYRSQDGGDSWELKDNGWYTPTVFAEASDIGCKVAVTPADPDRVYACLIGESKADDNGWIGVYYSLDEGENWVNPDGIDGGPYAPGSDMMTNWFVAGYSGGYHQGWYNFDLDASHLDPDKIWIGTIWDCESGNRGENIEYIRGTRGLEMHADVQDIEVIGDEIWIVSDGGINYSNDECLSVEIRNTGIGASTFWGFNQGWNEDTWTGGRYHNGDATYHENYGVGNTMFMGGAETATGYVNPLNNRLTHFSDITDKKTPGSLSESSQNIANFSLYPNESYFTLSSSEVEYDPRYSNHVYLGKDNIFYKSTDGGSIFNALFTFPTGSTVLEFEISRSNPEIIYCFVRVGGNCVLYKSEEMGASFSIIGAISSSSLSHLDLSLNPSNPDELWVISHYGPNGQKVYQTTNGGSSWSNRTTSTLDDHKPLDVLFQAGTESVVYVLTDYAVFHWDNSTADWVMYADGLPFVTQGLSLKPFYRDEKIRMSSGRGIWEAALCAPSMPIAQPMTSSDTVYCSRDTVQFDCYSVLNHAGATWEWAFSPEPEYVSSLTDRNPKVVFGTEGNYDVTLTVTDGLGNASSKTVENMVHLSNLCEADSVPGLAMECYVDGDYANVPDLNLEATEYFTISAWIKPDGIQGDYTGIVMSDGTAGGLNFRSGNELGYHWPGGAWWWGSGLIVPSGRWSHVAMVASPGSITIYLNGVGETHFVDLDPVDIHSMKIGSYQGWGGRNFKGLVDEVCIWDRALTQEEIRESRHLTRTGIEPFSDDLVAYYQFNLPASSQVLDREDIHHAQLSGGAEKVLSTAPLGGGVSDRISITSEGAYTLWDTETELVFGAGTVPNGEIVVSRLHIQPDSLPSSNPNTGNYWIVNNYGTESSFSPLEEIKFYPFNATPEGDPENARLFVRSENEDVNNWEELCGASALDVSSFTYDVTCDILSFSQFYIESADGTDIVTKLDENDLGLDLLLYPNPTNNSVRVQIRDGEIQAYELYNSVGQIIETAQINQSQLDIQLAERGAGIYVLRMQVNGEFIQRKIIRL
ncbi:MAG: T9SS type A sorting domain-containing protein [Flavobacteriales bacterium]|nr:T9SS type A sorting domain-containing protein [Flavobacteriales bacterium]